MKRFLLLASYVFLVGFAILGYSVASVGYTAVLAWNYGFEFVVWTNAIVVLLGLLAMILALGCAWLLRSAANNVNKE